MVGFVYAAGEYWNSGRRGPWDFLVAWGVNCIEFLVVATGAYLYTRGFYAANQAREI